MRKNLHNSKKRSTFARFFDGSHSDAFSGGSRFPRLTGTPSGAIV